MTIVNDVRRHLKYQLAHHQRLRALALGLGLVAPRTMHSEEDKRVLLEAADGAQRVVEIGVFEGGSALALCEVLAPGSELHLIDPYGHHPSALPPGAGATAWATKRVLARASRRRGEGSPHLHWHVAMSEDVAASWSDAVDLVFVDGDHSEAGCELDWLCWNGFVRPGGRVVFHDARRDLPNGRGLPGVTAFVSRKFRNGGAPGWEIVDEADRSVAVKRIA